MLSQEISAGSGGEVNTLKRQTAKGTSNSRSATKTTITTTTKNFKQTTHQFTTIEITVPHKCIRLGRLVPW